MCVCVCMYVCMCVCVSVCVIKCVDYVFCKSSKSKCISFAVGKTFADRHFISRMSNHLLRLFHL